MREHAQLKALLDAERNRELKEDLIDAESVVILLCGTGSITGYVRVLNGLIARGGSAQIKEAEPGSLQIGIEDIALRRNVEMFWCKERVASSTSGASPDP